MVATDRQRFVDELVAEVGSQAVVRDPRTIEKALRDNSWLSPSLTEHFDQLKEGSGSGLEVAAVVAPTSVDQLRRVIDVAVRHEVPMTPRGGATSNFGQVVPLEGVLLIDLRRLQRVLDVGDDSITVEAGALQGDVERAARLLAAAKEVCL